MIWERAERARRERPSIFAGGTSCLGSRRVICSSCELMMVIHLGKWVAEAIEYQCLSCGCVGNSSMLDG